SSGATSAAQTSRFSYFRLLTFAQQHYYDIVVDFPGVVDEAANPLLSHSEAIYVVCTPELTSMALARRRLYHLERRGMPDASLGVILNRFDGSETSIEQVEEMIGHKIVGQFPNDYQAVQESVESGGFVDPDTELGQAYTDFAAKLVGSDPPQSPAASRLKSLLRNMAAGPVQDL